MLRCFFSCLLIVGSSSFGLNNFRITSYYRTDSIYGLNIDGIYDAMLSNVQVSNYLANLSILSLNIFKLAVYPPILQAFSQFLFDMLIGFFCLDISLIFNAKSLTNNPNSSSLLQLINQKRTANIQPILCLGPTTTNTQFTTLLTTSSVLHAISSTISKSTFLTFFNAFTIMITRLTSSLMIFAYYIISPNFFPYSILFFSVSNSNSNKAEPSSTNYSSSNIFICFQQIVEYILCLYDWIFYRDDFIFMFSYFFAEKYYGFFFQAIFWKIFYEVFIVVYFQSIMKVCQGSFYRYVRQDQSVVMNMGHLRVYV